MASSFAHLSCQSGFVYRAACPLPPVENRLKIVIEAGKEIPYERSAK
ncbi:hypothetical protein [Paeniglutamicibacter gangotriensis]|nr:hypothetical protein [Paeniglutamicibacter gangotriensis]